MKARTRRSWPRPVPCISWLAPAHAPRHPPRPAPAARRDLSAAEPHPPPRPRFFADRCPVRPRDPCPGRARALHVATDHCPPQRRLAALPPRRRRRVVRTPLSCAADGRRSPTTRSTSPRASTPSRSRARRQRAAVIDAAPLRHRRWTARPKLRSRTGSELASRPGTGAAPCQAMGLSFLPALSRGARTTARACALCPGQRTRWTDEPRSRSWSDPYLLER